LPLESNQRVAGIDWTKDDHAVAVVDVSGAVVERFTVARTAAGLRELVRRLGRHQAGRSRSSAAMGRSWRRCSRPV
jgi:hypothetical protein